VARDTLIDFFVDLSHARGDFLVYDDGFRSRSYSYAEVVRAAHAFAAQLHELGVRKGDKVVFWSENRPEWIVAFWGCLFAASSSSRSTTARRPIFSRASSASSRRSWC
jgi:long-subunit acyl-CoA synthetase (AMP-forming)